MEQKYCSLKQIIDIFSRDSDIHICINDIAGILYGEMLEIDSSNKIHSAGFCDAAKSTAKGYDLCISCKERANKKAVYGKKEFSGLCPYGLYEFVKPVVIDNVTTCIIYIGNIVTDRGASEEKIRAAARLTGVDENLLMHKLNSAEKGKSIEKYSCIASLIDSYIRLVGGEIDSKKQRKHESGCRHKVSELIDYINYHYDKNISLKQAARLYFVNEKYLGRVFKSETGLTMHQYLNSIRIKHAVSMLKNTDKSILDISLECGFGNVTYFNRQFMKQCGITPTQYRNEHR